MCIATATDRYLVEKTLRINNIDKYFCDIFTCTEVGAGKENPLIFEKALECLGTDKSNTLIFEDALHAIKTAKKAGFKVVAVYDFFSESDTFEIINISDIYMKSLDEWRIEND